VPLKLPLLATVQVLEIKKTKDNLALCALEDLFMIGRKEAVLPVLASLIALTWYMLQPYSKYPRRRYKTVHNYLPRTEGDP
jgi:hypothetical protein